MRLFDDCGHILSGGSSLLLDAPFDLDGRGCTSSIPIYDTTEVPMAFIYKTENHFRPLFFFPFSLYTNARI